MSRRKGRILAFQGVYSWDVSQSPVEDILNFSWIQNNSEDESRTFASFIISGTVEHVAEIDELIKKHLSDNWTLERINKVSLAILRTSIFEMKFQNGSQPKIVIDEAVNIAREYGLEDSYKFINAVLDKIGKEL
ncbi:MAG: transcription antitermination factor NusB [Treponema sp.]|nr:transcription antitermination factor NusB [Treponema sp.]MBR4789485.1 transcription antitermination factor NusB [Treponema sp.]MBR5033601.1 transcription antitermination factor NusB [Treponema sp.]